MRDDQLDQKNVAVKAGAAAAIVVRKVQARLGCMLLVRRHQAHLRVWVVLQPFSVWGSVTNLNSTIGPTHPSATST